MRRIILTGALLIIRDRVITFRLIGALLTSLLWLTFLLTTYPYKHFELGVLSIASAFTLVCIYVGGLLVKLHNDLQVNFGAYVGARLTSKDIIDTEFELNDLTIRRNSPEVIQFQNEPPPLT